MYSNRHRLNASSGAPDTHTRKNKSARTKKNQSVRKGWILYAAKKKRVCAADHTSIQIGIAWTPLQLLVSRSHATTKQVSQKLGGSMRANKNWMCAAIYTCVLIRIVWTPFLLSMTHTHAIRKMVCQKRLESVCGKKQALTSGWFVVVELRTTHVVDLRPHVGLAGCQRPFAALFFKVVHLSRVSTVSVLAR